MEEPELDTQPDNSSVEWSRQGGNSGKMCTFYVCMWYFLYVDVCLYSWACLGRIVYACYTMIPLPHETDPMVSSKIMSSI